MKLIKHYDFTAMEQLDSDWNISVGDKWHNNELQRYVNKENNLFFRDGLVLRGTYQNGIYESARVNTKDKFFFKYGRLDFVAKVPKGVGTWPALWMMPQINKYGAWPRSGEIDIMEHVGRDVDKLFLCLHSETHNHAKDTHYYEEFYLEGLTDDFHTYSMEWNEKFISYLFDNKVVAKFYKGAEGFDPSPKGWPFDEEFYLIMNLCNRWKICGGNVDNTAFPQEFIIKDLKIYQ